LSIKNPKLGKITVISIGRMLMIKPINPIAKAMAHHRKRKQVVPNKKNNYNRAKEKNNARRFYIPEDSSKKETSE
jgi:hypothetical protein|tara:strand:+ start:596 stop:820 length:225 start_codon:yes stop_codon:yes gene_type:complete